MGMPTHFGRSKDQDFNFIMDRIRKKLKGWKERSMSFEGRSILIKAVAQAIPTYIMSCFLLPKGLCDRIERAVCSFWWGGSDIKSKVHWTKKSNLFKSKQSEGLGFRNVRDFNLAMLAKQVWRFHTQPNTLISKCFKAKYYPNTDVLHANLGYNVSYAWRSIYNSIWLINRGSCWRIGNGHKVRIWEDHLLPNNNKFKVFSPVKENMDIKYVNDLILTEDHSWNSTILNDHFLPIDCNNIMQIPLINTNNQDELMWMGDQHGSYTVKSGYSALQNWKK
jgi:hypothetical protein